MDHESPTAQMIAAGLGGRKSGNGWKARCPAHDDHDPSLSISEDDGKPLVHCLAGCSQAAVIDVLRARGLWPERQRINDTRPRPNGRGSWHPIVPPPADAPKPSAGQLRCDVLHEYWDADDRLLFYVRRFEAKPGKRKQFVPLTYGVLDGKKGWHAKAPDAPKPLYRLNQLSHAAPGARVFLCEGEKAADAAQRMFPDDAALSWMGGVNGDAAADLAPLANHAVIIWGDADKPGREAAARIAARLRISRILDTSGLPDGFDAADLEFEGCDDPDEWLAKRLPPPPPGPAEWLTVTDKVWDPDTLPPRPWIAPPYLMRQEIVLLHGPGAAGKSQLAIAWAVATALGRNFGRLQPRQRSRVLLANFEDNREEQLRRLSASLRFFGATEADLKGFLFRVSLGPKGEATMFEVGAKEGVILPTPCWEALENACERFRPDVVMVDPFVAINAVPENDNQLIRRVMTVLKIGLTQRFNCVLVIAHHDVKAGGSNEDSDQTNARGAGDIVNAVRFEFAVKKMSVQQAGAMNVQEDRRGFYFRLGSPLSKVNYDEPLSAAWFERKAVPIGGESTVFCIPWEAPVGTLDEAQTAELIEAIGTGSKYGPYSPQLGKGDRSLSPILVRLDIHSSQAQRRVLLGLKDSGAVEVVAFKRGGHGSQLRKGLRTPDGEPRNYEWQDQAEETEDDLL